VVTTNAVPSSSIGRQLYLLQAGNESGLPAVGRVPEPKVLSQTGPVQGLSGTAADGDYCVGPK
jgi:hypothetical protein